MQQQRHRLQTTSDTRITMPQIHVPVLRETLATHLLMVQRDQFPSNLYQMLPGRTALTKKPRLHKKLERHFRENAPRSTTAIPATCPPSRRPLRLFFLSRALLSAPPRTLIPPHVRHVVTCECECGGRHGSWLHTGEIKQLTATQRFETDGRVDGNYDIGQIHQTGYIFRVQANSS